MPLPGPLSSPEDGFKLTFLQNSCDERSLGTVSLAVPNSHPQTWANGKCISRHSSFLFELKHFSWYRACCSPPVKVCGSIHNYLFSISYRRKMTDEN